MAKLPSLIEFNETRRDKLKIKTLEDNTILITKDEAKEIFIDYLSNELDLISNSISKKTKEELVKRVNTKLLNIESSLENHINEKFDKLTEEIISKSISRIINHEVNRRVEEKLQKIKELLG